MTPFRQRRLLQVVALTCGLSGCSILPGSVPAGATISPINIPEVGSIIPEGNVQLSPSVGISLEKLVFWAGYAGAAYLILDPLAPNWEIEQAAFPDSHYHFSLKMKRFYAGGAGESRLVFHQRAKELMRQGGYSGYEVVEYSEGMESSVLGSQRVSQGVIRLTRK